MEEEANVIAGLLSEFINSGEISPEAVADLKSITQKPEDISQEDALWADSCLVADPELSDEGWSKLREALLDTITAQSTASVDAIEDQLEPSEGVSVIKESSGSDDQEGDVEGSDSEEDVKDIFRVWDLETPDDEEGDLIVQLKQALRDWSVDEIVAGMADLSLKPASH